MKTSCTIIVYHYEALPFLRACIRQIRKYKHPEIEQHIIITEQSSENSYNQVIAEFGNDRDVTIVRMKAICSGYSIDYVMRFVDIKTKYVCTMDVDAFPIHKNWLYLCVKLIEEYNFSFVGHHPDESGVTKWKSFEDAYASYGKYFHVAQCFRVGKTENFKYLSLNAGFTKAVSYRKLIDCFEFNNNDWADIAKTKGLDGYADSGVIAHWWEDKTTENDKFTFAEIACLGLAPKEGRYGRIFDNIFFHFMFSYNHTMVGNKQDSMGADYLKWVGKINEGFTDNLINEMLLSVNYLDPKIPRQVWDGKNKLISISSKELDSKIDEILNQ